MSNWHKEDASTNVGACDAAVQPVKTPSAENEGPKQGSRFNINTLTLTVRHTFLTNTNTKSAVNTAVLIHFNLLLTQC